LLANEVVTVALNHLYPANIRGNSCCMRQYTDLCHPWGRIWKTLPRRWGLPW